MRVETDVIPRRVKQFAGVLRRAASGVRTKRRRFRGVVGAVIVAASAGTVASMIASIVLGPIGDQVLARNGDAARGPYQSSYPGGGGADETPAYQARLPAPSWTEPSAFRQTGARRRYETRFASREPPRLRAGAVRLASSASVPLGHHSVCVRLCDGFFFPIGDVHGPADLETQAAVCSNACPGAPARLFVTPSDVSEIDKAVSMTDGKLYTALPVAFAHTGEVGPTCSCHAQAEGRAAQAAAALTGPTRDITMRDGDSVMTSVGWRVFKGDGHWPYTKRNFSRVTDAAVLSKTTRSTLMAMEDATLGRVAPVRPVARAAALDIRMRNAALGLKDSDGRLVHVVRADSAAFP